MSIGKYLTPLALLPLIIGCGGGGSESTDNQVDNFVIEEVNNAIINATYESNTINVSGINTSITLTVDGCEHSVNNGAFSESSTTISQGDTVKFRMQAGPLFEQQYVCQIQVGPLSRQFILTTIEESYAISLNQFVSSREERPMNLLEAYKHDLSGESFEAIPFLDNTAYLPVNQELNSITFIGQTDLYGETLNRIQTTYNIENDINYTVYPYYNSSFQPEECKSISVNSSVTGTQHRWHSFLTSTPCQNSLGRKGQSEYITIDVYDDPQAVDDLLYYTQGNNNNIIGYRFFSSSDYQHEDVIDIDFLNNNFDTIDSSFQAEFDGEVRIRYQPGAYMGFTVGSHAVTSGINNWTMNVINDNYSEFAISLSQRSGMQQHISINYTEDLPQSFTSDISGHFFTNVSLVDWTLSWSTTRAESFESAYVMINNHVNDERYEWNLRVDGADRITLPDLPFANRVEVLDQANIFIRLMDYTENQINYVYINGFIYCDNDVCNLSMNY